MTGRLFVYGTLAPGRSNAHELAGVTGTWQPATVTGDLLPQGWGAALGYPGIILGADGPVVDGFLLTSEVLDDHWERLDEFEGEGYDRVRTAVRLADASTVEAEVYVLRGLTARPASDAT